MKRILALTIALPLTAALTAGTPVPRAILTGQAACSAHGSVTEQTPSCPSPGECANACASGPCAPDPGTSSPCAPRKAGRRCVSCQCGIGVLASGVVVLPPIAEEVRFPATDNRFRSLERRPASPPPKPSV